MIGPMGQSIPLGIEKCWGTFRYKKGFATTKFSPRQFFLFHPLLKNSQLIVTFQYGSKCLQKEMDSSPSSSSSSLSSSLINSTTFLKFVFKDCDLFEPSQIVRKKPELRFMIELIHRDQRLAIARKRPLRMRYLPIFS